MPEDDFIGGQIATAAASRQRKVVNALLTVVGMLGLFGLLMVGLVIERVVVFIGFVLSLIALVVIYQRLPTLKKRVTEALEDSRGVAIALLVAILAAYPVLLSRDPYLIHVAALSAIFVVMALGLNITLGYAGLLDLSFAVYFGAGAYVSAQLAIHFGVSFWFGLIIGGVAGSFFGFIVAFPALRVHDHYLGLVTLGYGLMMNLLARNLHFLTNGTDGVINIPPPAIGAYEFTHPLVLGPLTLPFQANYYYLAVLLALVAAFINYRLRRSKLGRAWDAIREDEIAARCSGVNAQGLKILAFSTGAFFGGVGGAVYAHMIGFISPENFSFLESITILVMVVLGGAGNIMGVSVGAILLVVLPERFREFEHLRLLLFGLALVLLMINRPEGLIPRVRLRRMLAERRLDALLAPRKPTLSEGQKVGLN